MGAIVAPLVAVVLYAGSPVVPRLLVHIARLRSRGGVAFSAESPELVRLVFLLLTPIDQPDEQLALLAQIASLVGDPARRERLPRASFPSEVLDVLAEPPAA